MRQESWHQGNKGVSSRQSFARLLVAAGMNIRPMRGIYASTHANLRGENCLKVVDRKNRTAFASDTKSPLRKTAPFARPVRRKGDRLRQVSWLAGRCLSPPSRSGACAVPVA